MDSAHTHEWRFYVYARCKLGAKPSQIHKDLTAVLEDKCPSYRTIYRWILSFNKGKGSTKDKPRSGRPSTAMTEENIAAVHRMVTEDPFITIYNISKTLGVSRGSVHTILHHTLNMTNEKGWWVPYGSQKRGPRKGGKKKETQEIAASLLEQQHNVPTEPISLENDLQQQSQQQQLQQHQHQQQPMMSSMMSQDPQNTMGLMEDNSYQPPPPYHAPEPELISRVDCVIKEDPNEIPENGHFLAQL